MELWGVDRSLWHDTNNLKYCVLRKEERKNNHQWALTSMLCENGLHKLQSTIQIQALYYYLTEIQMPLTHCWVVNGVKHVPLPLPNP